MSTQLKITIGVAADLRLLLLALDGDSDDGDDTANAVSSRSQNSGYSTCLRPPVIGQVVHDSGPAPVAQFLGAIDTWEAEAPVGV